jgi:hypothetical protein
MDQPLALSSVDQRLQREAGGRGWYRALRQRDLGPASKQTLKANALELNAVCHACTGMKHTVSAKKNSSARGTSTRARKPVLTGRKFAVCVQNDGYEASLERNKIYVVLPDKDAENDGDLRVVDESGEDYLFSADRFVAIEVPAAVKASLLKAS